MEKKIWTRPMAMVEQFEANDYIAKCADLQNKYFSFVCDAGNGVKGDVWEGGTVTTHNTIFGSYQEISGGTNLTNGRTRYYHACGEPHYVPEADVASTFTSGYYNRGTYNDSRNGNFIPVVIWTDGGTDVHCTESLLEDIKIVQGNRS